MSKLSNFDIDGQLQCIRYRSLHHVRNIDHDIGYDIGCCMQNPMEFTAEQQPSLHGPPCAYAAESQPLVLWIPACSFCAFPQLAQPCSTVN